MKFKSIRENYSKLLNAFSSTGITLTEAQKSSLDTFIVTLESQISKNNRKVILATKKVVTENLEKKYKKLFESVLSHISENARLSAKIQKRVTSVNESKKIATAVNDYLNLYCESVLPKKTIVNYDKLHKLEQLVESLKDTLLVNDEAVEAKKQQLAESFDIQKRELETKLAKATVKLNESMKTTQKLTQKINKFKSAELLESKTKDLPAYEARQIKKILGESSVEEINRKFNKTLKTVQKQVSEANDAEEATLTSEIENILSDDDSMTENDMLKGRKHNGHIDEGDDCKDRKDEKAKMADESNEDKDEEVVESDNMQTDEIDESLMQLWAKQASAIC